MAEHTITLLAAAPASGCGTCLHSQQGSRCGGGLPYGHCEHPQLQGPAPLLNKVMAALAEVKDPDSGLSVTELQLVGSLFLGEGVAELTLTVSPHCGGGQQISEDCFAVLRRLLPDTDVFVMHAVAQA